MKRRHLFAILPLVCCACASGSEPAAPAPVAVAPEPPPAPSPPAVALEEPADPNEACAQIVAVAFAGAEGAPDGIARDEAAAQARASELLAKAKAAGTDFRALASAESDAPSNERGGAIGTFVKSEWPEKHAAMVDSIFALKVHGIGPVVKAPYGYAFARRCKVDKVHTRHLLIRYQGAKNAPAEITRTKEQALTLASELRKRLAAPDADFATLATEKSEDASKERGGDLGSVGRGLFVPPFEEAAWALTPNSISAPVESVYGYHLIQRLP